MTAINIKTLGRSSITGGLAQVWRILSRFILTPIIIGELGMEGYGAWTLVFSVAAYIDMSNLSLGWAYTKFTAEYVRNHRYDELSQIIGSGIALVAPVGLLGMAAAWFWGEALLTSLKVPATLAPDAAIALVVIIGMMVLRMTIGSRLEILSGLQRIDLTFRLYVLASIIEFAVSLPLLLLGHGILGLAIGHAAGQITINLAAYSLVRARLPQLRISPLCASRQGLRKIVAVGGRFQLLSVLNTVVLQGVKLLLSWLMGVQWVGIYELAHKLITLGKTASEAVIAPLMPAFASLRAGGNALAERTLFLKGSKADALFGGMAFAFLALLAPSILLLWTGQEQPWAAWAIRVLAGGEAIGLLTSIVSSSLRAQGLVGLESKRAFISVGIALALMATLVPTLQFEGLIYARLAAQVLSAAWYLRAYFRFSTITWGEYLEGTRIPRLALMLLSIGAGVLLLRMLLPPLTLPGLSMRWTAVAEVFLWSVPFFGPLGIGVWKLYLTTEDREQVTILARTITDRLRGRSKYEPPEIIVMTEANDEDAARVVDAAQALGRVERMSQAQTADLLGSGVQTKLVLALLGPGVDPYRLWSWIHEHRPDLESRLAFVKGEEDPLYEEHDLRHYQEIPDAKLLQAHWSTSSETDTKESPP